MRTVIPHAPVLVRRSARKAFANGRDQGLSGAVEFQRCLVAAVGESSWRVNGFESGNVVSDAIEAGGARRTRCRRAPEERTVVAGVHGPPSSIREEFIR